MHVLAAIGVFGLLCLGGVSTALKCYQCNTLGGGSCMENMSECPAGADYCLKHVVKVQGSIAVTKLCASSAGSIVPIKEGCEILKPDPRRNPKGATVCFCQGDGCNGGLVLSFSLGRSIAIGVGSILLAQYSRFI